MFNKKLITALVAGGLLFLMLAGGSALAAKGGGHGHGGGGTSGGSATLIVTPNPVPAYGAYQATGCGYAAGVGVLFNMLQPSGALAATGGTVSADGCVTLNWNANEPGGYTLTAYQGTPTNNWFVASTTFTAQ